MASISVIPEKFSSTLFPGSRISTVAQLLTDGKMKKLPAFLRGPIAAYFHGLPAALKNISEHLTAALKIALCPTVNRKQFYADFESHVLRLDEDPSLQ